MSFYDPIYGMEGPFPPWIEWRERIPSREGHDARTWIDRTFRHAPVFVCMQACLFP